MKGGVVSRRACALIGVWAWLSIPGVARAESGSDTAAAQGLFDDARALMAAGKPAEACPKFEESQRLDPGSGTLLNLAKCYEESHRLASAWSTYLEAAVSARATGNADREKAARELAAALAPRISKLVVQVPPDARVSGLSVSRDGAQVGAAQWGEAIPADEGQHMVVATASGYKEWRGSVIVTGEGTTAQIAVPALEAGSAAKIEATPGAAPNSAGLGTQRIAAIVSAGVGVVGIGFGTFFGLESKSDHDEASKYCSGSSCTDARGVSAGNDAHSAGNDATVAMIIGAVGLAAGAALWFTAPGRASSTQVGVGPASVLVRGVW